MSGVRGILIAIRGLLGLEGRPRGTDFYALAEREGRVPAAELAIAEAALAGGGPLAERAMRQLRETHEVDRLRSDDGSYEMRIVTFENLIIRGVPRAGWTSAWIAVETSEGRPLEFQVEIPEAGVVGFAGRTGDRLPWPNVWEIAPTRIAEIRAEGPWLRLPTPAELKADRARAAEVIGDWLDDPGLLRGRRGMLRADPPASEEVVTAFVEREAFELPDAYRDLLRVADGIQIGAIEILGTHDAYRLDIPGPTRLVIAPPNEDGTLVLTESGVVEWIDIDDPKASGAVPAPDLRSWVATRLRRPGRDGAGGAQ
jgi:hypothetical protein